MNLYFLIAVCLGGWVFMLVISNQRQQKIWEIEAKIAEEALEEQSGH
ncbi:MAG TPA: hypothetical protein VGG19_04685 [Tepidisphaeraceae bacterium]|jgi:hypothetical protein